MIEYEKVTGGYQITETISTRSGIKIAKPIKNRSSSMSKGGRITLQPGFFWDGPTGAIDTPDTMEASAFHDFICNEYNQGKLDKFQRKQGDKMFKRKLKETKMSKFRIEYLYQAVRKFFELKEWFKKIF